MQKLDNLKLDESKPASKHSSAFTSILSQLQDAGLPSFDPNVRGRSVKKRNTGNKPRNRSKSKEKQQDVSCYQYGHKGHKKPDCRYYKKELECRKQANAKGKKNERDGSSNPKDIEKANMVSNVAFE
ncbi:hypothetical protein KP509_39G032000 [Ceratopteris richardii]|uniref:Uncharacterized protein n=1 Tax=Ceratopteris richardii TaxID=49495 RepID=A0A8T2Q0P5_CERRI|nr:hypothetical protein KP509_39G032000 [Ceratopteris richardii]